jgi:Domain of unknown function (DUF6265)
MSMRSWTAVAVVVWTGLVLPATGGAQDTAAGERRSPNTVTRSGAAPVASIGDLAWLVGHWKGTGLGGVSEEVWAQPAGGVMMGMYRLVLEGAPSFYEFMHLAEVNGSLALKLKHFNPDLTAWEDKDGMVTFPLVKLAPNEAYFAGLTFRRSGDRLQIFLAMRDKDGQVREEAFDLTRVRP